MHVEKDITSDDFKKDPSAKRFVATLIYPSGWTVLSPWIQTIDGYWYRHHINELGYGNKLNEEMARFLAEQLNKYVRE